MHIENDDRKKLLHTLLEASEADVGVAFQVARVKGGLMPFDILWAGPSQLTEDGRAAFEVVDPKDWPALHQVHPRGRGAVAVFDEDRDDSPDRPRLVGVLGFPSGWRHECRVLIYADDALVGYIGVFRRDSVGAFRRSALRRVRQREAEIGRLLRRRAADYDLSFSRRSGEAVADADGRVFLGSDELEGWLVGRSLSERRAGRPFVFEGAEFKARPVRGPAGHGYCLSVRPLSRPRVDAAALLSPTQRKVAEYAACGATAREIATTLGAAVETVRSHLKEVYRRLEVCSRLELAAALEG